MDEVRLKGQSTNGKLVISGKSEMTDFLLRNTGKRILITMQSFDRRTTEAIIGFYYGKIIPDVRQAYKATGLHLTEADTELRLRHESPLMQTAGGRMKTVYDLDMEQMVEYIDWIKQYAAENLFTFIIDPRLI